MVTRSCPTATALRMRVSMSAMGSVIMIYHDAFRTPGSSPAGEFPHADTAHAEVAQVPARATAPLAAVVAAHLELRVRFCFSIIAFRAI
jgi:hypothetical protein